LVTKFNNDFFLISRATPVSFDSQPFVRGPKLRRQKPRSVHPTGDGKTFYVLSADKLSLYTGTTETKKAAFESPIEEARDLRVFGDQAVLLDKNGFHLVDSNLKYVAKLAARKVEVKSVALSNGRLAILYSNDLCRIWNVAGTEPEGLGSFENASTVCLSPDGKWAASESNGQLQIYAIDSKFDQPKLNPPIESAVFRWIGGAPAELLIAEDAGDTLRWKQLDPVTGVIADRTDLPADVADFVDFELAPNTQRYVAIQSTNSMSLWVTGNEPLQLNRDQHEFDASKLNNVRSMTFSEIKMDDADAIGTRLVVLANDGSADAAPELRIYLLAKEDSDSGLPGEQPKVAKYRVIEIEGALEKVEGRDLFDVQFSGEGRSLIEVDEDGTSTLLSRPD
jgi:hypothetical protein